LTGRGAPGRGSDAILLHMTRLLEEAIARVRQLPETDQDAIAQIVLDEIESERRWDELFIKSPQKLEKLADQAWAEHEKGQSEELDPDQL
jgi:hypothetical protein